MLTIPVRPTAFSRPARRLLDWTKMWEESRVCATAPLFLLLKSAFSHNHRLNLICGTHYIFNVNVLSNISVVCFGKTTLKMKGGDGISSKPIKIGGFLIQGIL